MGGDKETKQHIISQEQIDFVVAHKDDFPRNKYIRLSGLCKATFYKILKKQGNVSFTKSNRQREIEIVKKHYPTMSTAEIVEKYKISKYIVVKTVRRFGLRHTTDTEKRLGEKRAEAMKKAIKGKDRTLWTEKWKKIRRMEEMRVMCGMPQQTNIYICPLSKKARHTKRNLISKYRYFSVPKEPFTLCYDSLTQRVNGRLGRWKDFDENFYAKKYGFIFEPADED